MITAPDCACTRGWEALRGDPLPWLLGGDARNLHWRTLVELMRRPVDSPAVVRARDGAGICEPVPTLLEELHPDGAWWSTPTRPWQRYAGPGWRLVAAVQWGADPTDPRLQAGLQRLEEESSAEGGFASRPGRPPSPCLTARAAQAMAIVGWRRQLTFRELLAWLNEAAPVAGGGGWSCGDPRHSLVSGHGCVVTAAAVLQALAACDGEEPPGLRRRAVTSVTKDLGSASRRSLRPGHPNLMRTDRVELLAALAAADAPWDERLHGALRAVQDGQDRSARWTRRAPLPATLPVDGETRANAGGPSRWITLRATTALLRYAVDAGLPRLFPDKPSQ